MEDIQSKIAVGLITEIFKEVIKGVHTLASSLTEKGRNLDILGSAAQQYAERTRKRYNSMKIFGMSRPIPLDKIYTKVNMLEKIRRSQRATVHELVELSDIHQRIFGKKQDTKPGLMAVDEYDRLIVLGKPGSGKTTFLKHVLLQALSGGLSNRYVPIFISLHDVSNSSRTLYESIVNEFILADLDFSTADWLFVSNLLVNGKCLLLFDGLDEVSEERRPSLIREIIEISERHYLNKFIVSCRVAVYNSWFEKFADMEIADFHSTEIETFISNWFSEDNDNRRAGECSRIILNNPQLKELASTPLLLTLLCVAYEEGISLLSHSQHRVQLYKEALDALLQKWDSSRQIRRDDIYRHMTITRKRLLLSYLAAVLFEKGEYFVSLSKLEEIVAAFLKNIPEVDAEKLRDEAAGVIAAIEAHHGILVEQARDVHSFSHLTYFAANYVQGSNDSQKNLV
jgi:predicted NACHT family NTPase